VTGAHLARMITAGSAGLAVALAAARSARAGGPCARVEAPEPIPAPWVSAVAELERQLARLPASECQPVTLSLEPDGGRLRIRARAADGRRAERTVEEPADLAPAALGLVMGIPELPDGGPGASHPGSDSASPEPSARRPEAAPALPPPAQRSSAPTPPLASRASVPFGLWTGVSAGLRLTAPTALTVLDVEARADVILERWLLLATLRSAVVSCLGEQGVDCDVYNDVSFGAGVARRLWLGTPILDVGIEPSLVVMHMEYDGATEAQSVEGTLATLRVDVSARLAVPVGARWALTVEVEGGVAPSILASPERLTVPAAWLADEAPPPPYPAWSGAVRVGAAGALL